MWRSWVSRRRLPSVCTFALIPEDPFPDPANLISPPPSPIRPPDALTSGVVRISDEENPLDAVPEEQIEAQRRLTAAASSALTLEMIGDIPFAAVRPPENILFVCKLNPVTQDEDLELIFSRFGKILSCEVVRDRRSGDSLQYAFIEFDEQSSAEQVSGFASRDLLPFVVWEHSGGSQQLEPWRALTYRPTSRCKMSSWTIAEYGWISPSQSRR